MVVFDRTQDHDQDIVLRLDIPEESLIQRSFSSFNNMH